MDYMKKLRVNDGYGTIKDFSLEKLNSLPIVGDQAKEGKETADDEREARKELEADREESE